MTSEFHESGTYRGVPYTIYLTTDWSGVKPRDPGGDIGGQVRQAVMDLIDAQVPKPEYCHYPQDGSPWTGLCGGGGTMVRSGPATCPVCRQINGDQPLNWGPFMHLMLPQGMWACGLPVAGVSTADLPNVTCPDCKLFAEQGAS